VLDVVIRCAVNIPARFAAKQVDSIALELGGGAVHCGRTFEKLGNEVHVFAYHGDDTAGRVVASLLKNEEFNLHIDANSEFYTPTNVVAVDKQANVRYLMQEDLPVDILRHKSILDFDFDEVNVLHISTANQLVTGPKHPLLNLLRELRAKNSDLLISIDASKLFSEFGNNLEHFAGLVDIVFGNQAELGHFDYVQWTESSVSESRAQRITRSLASELRCRTAVITFGALGAVVAHDNNLVGVKGFIVEKPDCSNGAGDVLSAAFLHYFVGERRSASQSLEFASFVASQFISDPKNWIRRDNELEEKIHDFPRSQADPIEQAGFYRQAQRTFGYGSRFDVSRQLREHTLTEWIDRIRRFGKITQGTLLLDAGCGTGRFAYPISEKLKARVIGIDCCEEMLRVAKLKESISPPEWRFGDLTRLVELVSDEMGRFECIWMSSVLSQATDEFHLILEQSHAVLKDGATFLFRGMSRELVDLVGWYDFLPKVKSQAKEKYLPLWTMISHFTQNRFEIIHIEQVVDVDVIPVHEAIRRIKSGGFSWSYSCSGLEIDSACEKIQESVNGLFEWLHPSYFIVARKRQ
jgi:sugar/nucleoside kinase (ribokinase family)/2-polyprenyl-3-methyl-5-hydroxy-6-metoxy-1,4-benzoquinol methylase